MDSKRWFRSAAVAIGIMVADVLAMVGVTRAFLPHKPPQWATGIFFWALAWPVPLFSRLFPNTSGGSDHGPSLLAVGAAGLVDIILLIMVVDRFRASARRSPVGPP